MEPKTVRVEDGETASFKCRAENTRGVGLFSLLPYSVIFYSRNLQQRPELTWTRLDRQPLSTEAIVEKGSLNLYHVSIEDAGGYRCTGTLPDTGETAHDDAEIQISPGMHFETVDILFTVTFFYIGFSGEPFEIQIDEPKSKNVFENGNANFHCRVISKTTVSFSTLYSLIMYAKLCFSEAL